MSDNPLHALMMFLAIALWTGTVLFTWRLVYHSHAPRIKFSKKIHKTKDGKLGSRYHITFQNVGRRTLFNAEFRASLFLKQNNASKYSWQEIPIPVNQDGEFIVKVARIEPLVDKQNDEEQKIALELNSLKANIMPEKTDFLEVILTSEAYIKVFFSGYDMVTGSKKTFTSRKY